MLKRGECAFREGDAGDKFYIIEDGSVRIEAQGKAVTTLREGSCFGEAALLSGAPRNASVICESAACKLLAMDVASFSRIMRRSSALHSELSNLAAARDPHPHPARSPPGST